MLAHVTLNKKPRSLIQNPLMGSEERMMEARKEKA
jgi:hypothetical protein